VPSPTRALPQPAKRTIEVRGVARPVLGATALLIAAAAAAWLALRPGPLPVLGTLPEFALVERSGTPLGSGDLAGQVWIADFVFTHCPDFCPALTARMAGLQKTLPQGRNAVRLVSISVDPARDTPDVLRDYAARAGADERWLFLTGPRDAVAGLLRDGFKVAWADDGPPTSPITHSDRFVLVDRTLRIRGYYHGTDADDLARLVRDAVRLRDGRVS
jgi:protein SCO1/2